MALSADASSMQLTSVIVSDWSTAPLTSAYTGQRIIMLLLVCKAYDLLYHTVKSGLPKSNLR